MDILQDFLEIVHNPWPKLYINCKGNIKNILWEARGERIIRFYLLINLYFMHISIKIKQK